MSEPDKPIVVHVRLSLAMHEQLKQYSKKYMMPISMALRNLAAIQLAKGKLK